MKYVISEDTHTRSYVEYIYADGSFNYTTRLDEAKQFKSVKEAIRAINNRSGPGGYPRGYSDFNILGIEPVNPQPKYREVPL